MTRRIPWTGALPWIVLAAVLSIGAKGCQGPPPAACDACRAQPATPGCAVVLASCPAPTTTTTMVPVAPWCQAGSDKDCRCVDGRLVADAMSCAPPATTLPHTPPTTVPAAGCKAPEGVAWRGPGPTLTSRRAEVVKVLRELAGCPNEGTDCPLPGDNQQSWQVRVIQELRLRGLCAGQHIIGVTDQIAVAEGACDGPWSGWYVYACAPARPGEVDGLGNPLDICPIVGRGKVRWAVAAPSWVPVSGCAVAPPPTTLPGPPVTEPPAPGACPLSLPLPAPYEVGLRIEPWGTSGQVWDATAYIVGPSDKIPPPAWLGNCRALQCDLSPEKDTANGFACSRALCGDHIDYAFAGAGFINWQGGQNCDRPFVAGPNCDQPFKVKLTLSGSGRLTGTCPLSGASRTVTVP